MLLSRLAKVDQGWPRLLYEWIIVCEIHVEAFCYKLLEPTALSKT